MSTELAERIAKSVLYEGYMLYPYRPSSTKNRQHWNFGTLYPESLNEVQSGHERASLQLECLVTGAAATLKVGIRFLHLLDRQVLASDPEMEWRPVASLSVDGRLHETWQEGAERRVDLVIDLSKALAAPQTFTFAFPGFADCEELRSANGELAGAVRRTQREIRGECEAKVICVAPGVHRLTMRLNNKTDISAEEQNRPAALLRSLLSAHLVLQAQGAEFASVIDPPENLKALTEQCSNIGVYPVLVGEVGQRDILLAAPIALHDYPQIAPESAGDFFDATEIDELLTLRVMTLTDDEKREVCSADEHVRKILERAESTGREQMMRTHGALREVKPVKDKAA
jgi:hypothetical protein